MFSFELRRYRLVTSFAKPPIWTKLFELGLQRERNNRFRRRRRDLRVDHHKILAPVFHVTIQIVFHGERHIALRAPEIHGVLVF